MRVVDVFQVIYDDELLVKPNQIVGQQFKSIHNNLAGIKIAISNPNLGGSAYYAISLTNAKGEVLQTEKLRESNLGYQTSLRYDFPAISNSKDQIYNIEISLADKKAVYDPNNKYLFIMYTKKDAYTQGYAYIGNQNLPGDIQFQTYYQTSPINYFSEIIHDFTNHFLLDKFFVFFYFILIISLTLILFRKIRLKK